MKFAMISFAAAVGSVTAQHIVPVLADGSCPTPARNTDMYKLRTNGVQCIKTVQPCGCNNGEGDADANCFFNDAGTAISKRCDRNKCDDGFFPVEMLKADGTSRANKLYTCQTKCHCNRGEAKEVEFNEDGTDDLQKTAVANTVCHSPTGQRCTSCEAGTTPDGTPKFILSPSASKLANGNTNYDQLFCQWQRHQYFKHSCRAGTPFESDYSSLERKLATTSTVADVQWCSACDDGSEPFQARDWTPERPRMICDLSVPCSCTDIEGNEIGAVDTKHMEQCWREGAQSCLACDETRSLYQMANGRYMCGWDREFGSSPAMMQVEAETIGTLLMADGKCDHSACMEWTCKEWCQCYQEEFDGVYEENDCNQDDGTVCKCPRWNEVIPEHTTCELINELEDEAARREECEHISNPHCAWRNADKTCAMTAVSATAIDG